MDWYYKQENNKIGPISKDKLDELVKQGNITPETSVWNENTSEWLPFSEVSAKPSGDNSNNSEAPPASDESECAECGRSFSVDEMIKYGESMICASCKPVFFQKIKEGVSTKEMQYGGFWIRFGAKFIDGIITGVVTYAISLIGGMAISADAETFGAGMAVIMFLQYAIPMAYTTFFIGKFAATPGKMACGLKIVTADGGTVSYLRAAGRHLSEFISGMILAIGYIMAAFDQEKRTLHDRMCSTRVIRK